MDREEDYTIEWKNHACEAFGVISKLHGQRAFTDVTLHCGDKCFRAHRVVLAACSSYLERVLGQIARNSASANGQHAAIVLKDAPADLLEVCVSFMYTGVAYVPSEKLDAFMTLAESLEIRGLRSQPSAASGTPPSPPPPPKRDPQSLHTSSSGHVGQHSAVKRRAPLDLRGDVGLDSQNKRTTRRDDHAAIVESLTEEAFQSVEEEDVEEIPFVKSEAPVDEEAWVDEDGTYFGGDDYQEGETEFGVNDTYPTEYAGNIPPGVSAVTLERVSKYLWRGWPETSGASGPAIHFCSVCGYRSLNAHNAMRHERTHTKERPYECPTCGRRFSDRSSLTAHSATLHGIVLTKKRV